MENGIELLDLIKIEHKGLLQLAEPDLLSIKRLLDKINAFFRTSEVTEEDAEFLLDILEHWNYHILLRNESVYQRKIMISEVAAPNISVRNSDVNHEFGEIENLISDVSRLKKYLIKNRRKILKCEKDSFEIKQKLENLQESSSLIRKTEPNIQKMEFYSDRAMQYSRDAIEKIEYWRRLFRVIIPSFFVFVSSLYAYLIYYTGIKVDNLPESVHSLVKIVDQKESSLKVIMDEWGKNPTTEIANQMAQIQSENKKIAERIDEINKEFYSIKNSLRRKSWFLEHYIITGLLGIFTALFGGVFLSIGMSERNGKGEILIVIGAILLVIATAGVSILLAEFV